MFHHTRVGVLRGGPSNEYEVSLQSGAAVLSLLNERFEGRYRPRDIFIDKNGLWHIDGVETTPHDAIRSLDVVWNALHGTYGEDGKVQSLLEHHKMPFTGSGSLSSAIGMNKSLTKNILKGHGIRCPYSVEIPSEKIITAPDSITREVFLSFNMPAIVKPNASGSSVGVSIVRYYDSLNEALREAAKHSDTVLLEEYISGAEATCGVVEGFRGHPLYALPPVEIRPETKFFDYEAKYAGKSKEICPSSFSHSIKSKLEDLARKVHNALGLRHYSRTDFMIHPKRGIFVLEVNTLPGLTGESLMPKALRAVGSDTHELVEHVIGLALRR